MPTGVLLAAVGASTMDLGVARAPSVWLRPAGGDVPNMAVGLDMHAVAGRGRGLLLDGGLRPGA
jgi:hypothetical protein